MQFITVDHQDSDQRLDRYLKRRFPDLSQGVIQKWARKGLLRLDGKRCKVDARVMAQSVVKMPSISVGEPEETTEILVSEKQLNQFHQYIIHEDQDVYVINKPAGLPVHGGTGQETSIDQVLKAIAAYKDEDPKLVHRLDKDTSGLLVIAKNRLSAAYLSDLFQSRDIKKQYLALVVGKPEKAKGRIEMPLAKRATKQGERMMPSQKSQDMAITDYQVLDSKGKLSLVLLSPVTGKTHQLRAHCAYALKTPILGDGKFGGKDAHPGRQEHMHLHAFRLNYKNKQGLAQKFQADLPSYFFNLVKTFSVNL